MDLQNLINSRMSMALALSLGRVLPPGAGHRLAETIASWVAARRDSAIVKAVRSNQSIVARGQLSPEQLDQAVLETLQHTARCLFDFYHYFDDPAFAQTHIVPNPHLEELIEGTQNQGCGQVAAGIHMSNFDLIMLAAIRRGGRCLALSAPEPRGSYTWQNELRRRSGLELAPASVSSLRQALSRLASGGTVLTGLDRPDPGSKYRVIFFGHPAALPVMHVFLALKANVPVVVLSSVLRPDGLYQVLVSDPIPMEPHPDRGLEVVRNAERVLKVAEDMISTAPRTWAMFYPVWPDVVV